MGSSFFFIGVIVMAETLELKIKSSADQTAKSIENLENKLRSLGGALSSISGSGLYNFSSSLREFGTSIRELSSIDTRTFSKVAQNVQRLGNIDSSKLIKSATALNGMSRELSAFSGLAQQSQNITTLTQSISKLGSKSATNAASNIKALGKALKEVMATLSNAPRVNQSIIHMTNALANLASQGSKVGSASRSLTASFSNVTKSAERTKSGFGGLSAAIGKFYATYWLLIRATGKLRDAVDLSSQLTEVQNVVDTTFGDMTYKVDEFTKHSIQDLGMSELSVEQISSRFQAMGTAVGITSEQVSNGTSIINKKFLETKNTLYQTSDSMADISLNLTRLAADMASFYDVDQADVAKSLQSVFTGTIAPLRRYGLDLTQATLKEWALKNGIDANIKSMSQAEKVLLRYQYVMANTTAAQGDFAKTANTWANSVRVLKQEFQAWGAVVGGIVINVFKPLVIAMNRVMIKVINFTKTIADALGAIFGWTIETSASGVADSTNEVADSMADVGNNASNANRNANKLKKTLLSIDEIHALDDNGSSSSSSGGSGGSGAGGGGTDAAVTSNLTRTTGLIEKYKSSISSLGELGSYIGRAITNSLNSINWDRIYQSAKNFGKGLADFLNGLISPSLFGALGKTIAGALNTALHFLNSFGTTFNWKNFGKSIAAGINNFFATFDFANLAQTINTWVQGIYSALKEAIKNVNWKNVWNGIKEFLTNLDIETVEIIIGALVIKKIAKVLLAGTIGKIIKDKLAGAIVTALGAEKGTSIGAALLLWIKRGLSSIAVKIGLVVEGLFSGLSLSDSLAVGFGKLAPIITSIATILGGVVLAVTNFVSMLKNGFSALNEVLMLVGTALATVGAIIAGVSAAPAAIVGAIVAGTTTIIVLIKDNWESIKKIWSKITKWFDKNVITPIIKFFKNLLNDASKVFKDLWDNITKIWKTSSTWFSTNVLSPVTKVFSGLWDNILKIWKPVGNWFKKNVISPITSFFKGLKDDVSDRFEALWQNIENVWNGVSTWFSSNVVTPIVGFFEGFYTRVGQIFQGLWIIIQAVWIVASTWFNTNVVTPIVGFFKNLKNSVVEIFNTLWSGIKNVWNGVSTWFNTNVTKPLKNVFDTLWKGIKAGMIGAMNAVIGGIEKGINFIVDGINNIIGGFNKVVKWAAKVADTDWGGVDLVPKVTLPKITAYSTGGFPKGEDGMFLANHNELVGKFSNGKTAVANNEQITEGIRRAVVDGMMEVMMNTSGQGSSNAPIIENTFKVDSETLYRITQRGKAKHDQRYNVVTEF